MAKEQEKVKSGKPWEVYGTFQTFEAADQIRNTLKEGWEKDKIEGMQVKVKRMSAGLFKVKTRISPEYDLGRRNNNGKKSKKSRKGNTNK